MAIRWHEEDPAYLEAAISFTAAELGLDPRLVEKDYFCSVLLERLASGAPELVFKGGTCLTKIHLGFYRLSEDLDFSLPTPVGSSRGERSRAAAALRTTIAGLTDRLPGFDVLEPLQAANASTQYSAVVAYTSLGDSHQERISIEIGLREPLLEPAVTGEARTALLDPVTGGALVAPYPVACLSFAEAMAEKARAALSRREVAIRDFFDLDHGFRSAGFDSADETFLALLRRKLAVPGTDLVDLSEERIRRLRAQLDAQLRPVLRERDLASFDLERAIARVRGIAGALGRGR